MASQAGVVPSFGPPDRTFLGFLGSITRIAEALTADLRAYGSLGMFVPPPRQPDTLPGSALELTADHLLIAHALIASAGPERLRLPIESILHEVGVERPRAEQSGGSSMKIH